jgi:glutamate-1-semialdehyde aminotransferase
MDDLYEHPPVWVSHGEGAYFTDVDGHTYLDMWLGPTVSVAHDAESVNRYIEVFEEFLAEVT